METGKKQTIPCPECGADFEQMEIEFLGRTKWMPSICPKCVQKREEEAIAAREKAKQEAIQFSFEAFCPPLYRHTDISRLPQALLEPATSWTPAEKALGFVGDAGAGKTRTMFVLLKRLNSEGLRIVAISSVRLAKLSVEQFSDDKSRRSDAITSLERLKTVPILFIDDLGKQKFTERAELEIFDILEHRTSHLKPTFWTANASGYALSRMLSSDRGEPILRRLEEFTQIIHT